MIQKQSKELALECRRLSESCLYTSTSFFIWLRVLRITKLILIVLPLVLGSLASFQLLKDGNYATVAAIFAFLSGLLPTVYEALKIDKHIQECVLLAGQFKNLQDGFRKVALVSIHKPFSEFENEVNQLVERLEKARELSITPPEIIFRWAQYKVKKGDYTFDIDLSDPS
jgi:hypothetical protein